MVKEYCYFFKSVLSDEILNNNIGLFTSPHMLKINERLK